MRLSASALAALAVLAGFALRTFRLGYQELRGDETFGYFFSLNGFGRIVSATLELREPHPIASYWLQHAWIRAAGSSEFALRFTSVWFGTLAVALIYALARRVGLGNKAAALAAAFLALSPYALWHSQDARMYSMSLALTLASSALALDFFHRPRPRAAVAYVLVTLLALHTHYFAAFVIVTQDLWFLWRVLRDARFRRSVGIPWIATQAALFALLLPWLIAARSTLGGYRGNGDSPAWLDALLRTARTLAAGEMAPLALRSAAALAAALALIVLLVGTLRRRGRGPRDLGFAAFLLAIPLVATWLSSLSRPIFNERYLVAAAPGLFILLAAGVDRRQPRPERILSAALAVILLVLSLVASGYYLFDPAYSKSRGWRELAAELRALTGGFGAERAWVVANGPDPTLWYYFPQQATRWAIPFSPGDVTGAGRVAGDLAAAGVERVVVPLSGSPGWDGEGIAQDALSRRFEIIATEPAGPWRVLVAERPPASAREIGASFEGGLRLESAGILPSTDLSPGELLGIHLTWTGPEVPLPPGLKITLQLLDSSGSLVAQSDEPLVIANGRSSHGLRVPDSLAPGTYRLIAAFYDPNAPGLPRLLTEDGRDSVELAVAGFR
jgi:hypothetical protein